jgi:hypothetical protein
MNQEQMTIDYDQYMSLPLEERNIVFGEISVENCALLMKTHVERWLAANHPRLSPEQVAVIDEIIRSIKPESYQAKRDYFKATQAAEKLYEEVAAVFSREEVIQMTFLSGGQCAIRQTKED